MLLINIDIEFMDIALPKVNYDLIQAGPVGSLDAYIQGVLSQWPDWKPGSESAKK